MTVTMVVQFGQARIPRWVFTVCGVDLGHHQRHRRVHPEGAGLVDHHRARLHDHRRVLLDCAEPAEQKAISTPLKADGSMALTGMASPRKVTVLPTERARRERAQLAHGKLPLLQDAQRGLTRRRPSPPTTATLSLPDAIRTGPPLPGR